MSKMAENKPRKRAVGEKYDPILVPNNNVKYKETNQLERIDVIQNCLLFYDGRGVRIATYDPEIEGSSKKAIRQLELACEAGYITGAKYKQYLRIVSEEKKIVIESRVERDLGDLIEKLEGIRASAKEKRSA